MADADFLLMGILKELREKQDETLKIVRGTESAQARLEERIAPLFDNGQPGEITVIKNQIDALQNARERSKGFLAGIFTLQSVVIAAAVWLLHRVGLLH